MSSRTGDVPAAAVADSFTAAAAGPEVVVVAVDGDRQGGTQWATARRGADGSVVVDFGSVPDGDSVAVAELLVASLPGRTDVVVLGLSARRVPGVGARFPMSRVVFFGAGDTAKITREVRQSGGRGLMGRLRLACDADRLNKVALWGSHVAAHAHATELPIVV